MPFSDLLFQTYFKRELYDIRKVLPMRSHQALHFVSIGTHLVYMGTMGAKCRALDPTTLNAGSTYLSKASLADPQPRKLKFSYPNTTRLACTLATLTLEIFWNSMWASHPYNSVAYKQLRACTGEYLIILEK